jgi:2,5-diketo-D-gluconate reductase B
MAAEPFPPFDAPRIGLGTRSTAGRLHLPAIEAALAAGYRHIDTAQVYESEADVGLAFESSRLPRSGLFLTTKIDSPNLSRTTFRDSLHHSLERLRTDYVDLTLIHWPGFTTAPMEEYMQALLEARDERLTIHVGVSNFSVKQIKRALEITGPGVLANNQVEVHPFLQNRTLKEYCVAQGIAVTAYMPAAGGLVNTDPVLRRIADKHDASPTQVSLAWLLGEGLIAIPSSNRPEHLRENLAAQSLRLSASERDQIAALDRGLRLIDPPGFDWG